MNTTKKILLLLALTALSTAAWAQQGLQGSGTSTNPYRITSADDWNTFAQSVTDGTTYAGQFVKLTADISTSVMVGSHTNEDDYHAFSGTFDGDGHTITLDLTGSGEGIALFSDIEDATLKNLKAQGTVTTDDRRPATFAIFVAGNSTISNCLSTVAVSSTRASGWVDGGGFVGRVSSSATLNMTGCAFHGSVTFTDGATTGGGMVGFTQSNATVNLTNCLYSPSALTLNVSQYNPRIFVSGYVAGNLTNCYYNDVAAASVLGEQGKQAFSITGIKSANVDFLVAGTTYDVSGISAYDAGMKYAGTCYAGNGETVSLFLTNDDHPGYTYGDGYIASAGTLNGTGNPYTLTMPNQDVTIEPIITAYTVSVECTPNIADAAQVSLDNSTWSSSVSAAVGEVVYCKTNNVIGYTRSGYTIETENGGLVSLTDGHFTMPAANVTYYVDFSPSSAYIGDYTVTLSPGMGGGEPIVYTFDPATAKPNAATAGTCQFYYVNYNTLGFRLPQGYCPSSFTAPNGGYVIGWDGWSNNGYITLTSTATTFTAMWASYTVTLSPGVGGGEPIVYTFHPENAAPNAATADPYQFYYVNYNTLGFRLPYGYCPSSFTSPNGLSFHGWEGGSNNGYNTLTSTTTTFTAMWASYTVTLSPGVGGGEPIVYTFNPENAALNAATVGPYQFYYVNYNTIGFRLGDDCPNSFTAPEGLGFSGWNNSGYVTLTSQESTFTAQWGNPDFAVNYIDGNGEYHLCSNTIELTGGQGQTTLEGGWYVVNKNITYDHNTLTLNGDVTLILCDRMTMTVTAARYGINGNGHSLTIYGQSLNPNVAGTLNVIGDGGGSCSTIDLGTYTQHSGNVIVSSPSLKAIYTRGFTLNGGSLEASGNDCGIATSDGSDLTINGGTVTATSTQTNVGCAGISGGGNVVINGGKVETNKIFAGYNITLGYTHPDDYIKSDNFYYAYSGSGTVSVKSGQTFYYENEGENVIVSGTIVNPNSTIAGKRLRPYLVNYAFTKEIGGHNSGNGGWNLIASPLQGSTNVGDVGGLISNTASHYDLYRFNQAAQLEWENYKAHSTTDFMTLENGRGYLYANQDGTTLVFSGTPYIGNGVVDLIYSTANSDANMHGWNLVGNPFGTAATLGTTPFYRMNATGTEIIVSETNTVDAMEGIFVKATTTGQSVTFTQATAPLKSPQRGDIGGFIVLDLGHGNAVIDRAIVRLGEGQTLPKFQMRDNSTKIYIPQVNEDYAVVSVGGTDGACTVSTEIPVNFRAEENGTYTLTFSSENVDFDYLHLIDNLTGADVDLLATNGGDAINRVSTYTFTAKTTDYESRFKLVFSVGGDANDDNAVPFAFINNGNIIVNGEGTLQVMDVMGRVIVQRDVETSYYGVSTTGMTAGVYVLRLINGNNVRTQKIVIP